MSYSKEELLEHRDRLAIRIEVAIFNAIWGAEAAQRVAVRYDPQVLAGVNAMTQAAELLLDPVAYAKRTNEATDELDSAGSAEEKRVLNQPKPQ